MAKCVVYQFEVKTPGGQIAESELAEQINTLLDFGNKTLKGIVISPVETARVYDYADPTANEFQCIDCAAVFELAEAIEAAEGQICSDCKERRMAWPHCLHCKADLNKPESVERRYVNKTKGPDVTAVGHYAMGKSGKGYAFQTDRRGAFDSECTYTLPQNPDRCVQCQNSC